MQLAASSMGGATPCRAGTWMQRWRAVSACSRAKPRWAARWAANGHRAWAAAVRRSHWGICRLPVRAGRRAAGRGHEASHCAARVGRTGGQVMPAWRQPSFPLSNPGNKHTPLSHCSKEALRVSPPAGALLPGAQRLHCDPRRERRVCVVLEHTGGGVQGRQGCSDGQGRRAGRAAAAAGGMQGLTVLQRRHGVAGWRASGAAAAPADSLPERTVL